MNRHIDNGGAYAVVIGGANIDIHGRSNKELRLKDSSPGLVYTSTGGVARNIAENLARLGVDSRLVTAVGADHYGRMLSRLSQEAGINVQHVQVIGNAPTSTYLSVLDDAGDMHVGISDMSIIDHLNVERLRPLYSLFDNSSLIVLDTNLPDDSIAWLVRNFVTKPIFADTVSTSKATRLLPYLSAIHTLKASAIEAEALTGLDAKTPSQLQELAKQLHDSGVARVFITRGEQGVFFSTGHEHGVRLPARSSRTVLNAGGAGDAFLAGVAYAWMTDLELDDTLRFALAAADIALSHVATSSPCLSLAAVQQAMEARQDA